MKKFKICNTIKNLCTKIVCRNKINSQWGSYIKRNWSSHRLKRWTSEKDVLKSTYSLIRDANKVVLWHWNLFHFRWAKLLCGCVVHLLMRSTLNKTKKNYYGCPLNVCPIAYENWPKFSYCFCICWIQGENVYKKVWFQKFRCNELRSSNKKM